MLYKKDSRFVLAFDFGESFFKAVFLERKKNKFALLKYFRYGKSQNLSETNQPPDELSIVKECLKNFNLKSNPQVFFTFSNPSVVIRYLNMPKIPRRELKGAIELKLKNSFPFDLASAYTYFWSSAGIGSWQELFVSYLAVVKDLIDEKVALLKKANLFADGFGVPAMVVAEVYEATTFTQETGVIFLDLGHFASNISIVYKGQAIFSRIFSTGCYHLEEALKTVFVSERGAVKFTDEEVAEILYKEGVFGNKPDNKYKGITNFQIMALMRPVLERLENEINRTRDYLKQTSFSFAIRKIFICGGGAGIKNFDLYLAKVSGLDVVVDNKVNWLLLPKDKSGQLVGFNIPQYAMVLGTAKGGIKTALPLVSEARGKFAFMDFFFLRNALAVVFFLSSVLYMTLVIINFSYYQRLFYLEKRIEELEWVNVQSLPTQTKSESEKFFDKMAYDPGRITEFLKYLGNELPKEVVLEFMAINNDNGMIKLRGHIYHNDVSPEENLAKIMSAIKNYGQFGSPHLLQGVVKEDLEGKPIFFDLEITGGSK